VGFVGETVIDFNIGAVTVSVAEPVTPPEVAEIVVLCPAWAWSNASAATINAKGVATIRTGGQKSTISATSGSISGSTTLTTK
jgi:hypothetical protein